MKVIIMQDWEQIAIAFVAVMQAIKGLILLFKTNKNDNNVR